MFNIFGSSSPVGKVLNLIPQAIGSVTGANATGSAISGRAEDQWQQAQIERGQALKFAEPTAQELDQQRLMIESTGRQLAFEKQGLDNLGSLLGQISPVLAAGFAQQMAILKGEDTGALANPISRQIEIERQKQVSRVGQASGTGESTASIAANAMFAQQAGMARMNALQALSGINAQNAGVMFNALGAGNQTTANTSAIQSNVLKALGSVQERQLNASLNSSMVNQAGAKYAGQIYEGQATQGLLSSIAGGASGAYVGKKISK